MAKKKYVLTVLVENGKVKIKSAKVEKRLKKVGPGAADPPVMVASDLQFKVTIVKSAKEKREAAHKRWLRLPTLAQYGKMTLAERRKVGFRTRQGLMR